MTKEQLLETVQQLPANFELEDLFERLPFIQRLEQAKQGDVVSFKNARKRFYGNEQANTA